MLTRLKEPVGPDDVANGRICQAVVDWAMHRPDFGALDEADMAIAVAESWRRTTSPPPNAIPNPAVAFADPCRLIPQPPNRSLLRIVGPLE